MASSTLSGPGFLWGLPGFAAFFVLLAVVLLAKISGRLLGIKLGWRRTITAGFGGFVLGWVSTWLLGGAKRGPQALSWQGVLFSGLVATMLIAATLELLARPGRLAAMESRLRGSPIPHPVRSMRQRVHRSRRYLQVTRIAARHGLSSYLGGRRPGQDPAPMAREVAAALEEAGGMFIKLGQVLSTRSDLLPPEFIAELSRLQDRVPAADPAEVDALLTAELGASPDVVFTSFDKEPLAAASIAQAHRAVLGGGEQVIVKVQRPGVRALVERDLDILLRMARSLELRAAWAREYAVLEMTQGFAAALREELDFGIEARNILAVGASATVKVPRVYSELSTRRVLVMEFLDGVSVREADQVLAQTHADRHGLACSLLGAMLRQVMLEGTFHADPHPGNVLVLRDGQLAMIDFGSVGRLDPLQQAALRRLMLAVARRNPAELHDSLLDLAQVRKRSADDLLERSLAQFIAQYLGPGMVPGAAMFNALFRLLMDFGVVFPPVIGGVFRALVTLEGTLVRLSPGFEIVEESRRLTASWLGEMFGPASLREAATDEALSLLPVLRRLPRRLDRITAALDRGTLSAGVRILGDERDRQFIRNMVGRAVLAFVGATFGIMSVMLLNLRGGPLFLPGGPGRSGGTSLFHVFGYIGLFLSLVLILRVIITIIREGI